MALPTTYSVGTASVANGSQTITFGGGAMLGTTDAPNIMPGDLFLNPAQPTIPPQRIASVNYTAGTAALAVNWPGTTMSTLAYEVRYVGIVERSTAQTRKVLELLGQVGNTGIAFNAFGDFVDRSSYDTQAAGYAFLSLDGDGATITTPVVFIKASSASGDWSAAVRISAPLGDYIDISMFAADTPLPSAILLRFEFTCAAVFAAGLADSVASAGITSTGSAALSIQKNGVEFGTVTFSAATTAAVLASASGVTFAPGDIFAVVAPGSADATLADISLSLRGTRDTGSGLTNSGLATLDFGASPGDVQATVTVTGVTRLKSTSLVTAWLQPGAGTADHSDDEHKVAGMRLAVSDIIAGTGFTIYGFADEHGEQPTLHYGQWNVAWTFF